MSGQGENEASDGVDAPAVPGQFLPTRWSLVSDVRRDDPARAEAAECRSPVPRSRLGGINALVDANREYMGDDQPLSVKR